MSESVDPRIRRTRQLLQQGLEKVLRTKDFDKISVQDIAEAATVNRATFYDHYSDKFALLECMVGSRFVDSVEERGITFRGGCSETLKAIVLAVCDYLAGMKQWEPHMELAVIKVVKRMLLEGLARHPLKNTAVRPEIIAAAASWAIYGAAKEWTQTPGRCEPEEMANTVVQLVSPILQI